MRTAILTLAFIVIPTAGVAANSESETRLPRLPITFHQRFPVMPNGLCFTPFTTTLTLEADGTYTYHVRSGPLRLRNERLQGMFIASGSEVRLDPIPFPWAGESSRTYYPARWGERLYLVAENELPWLPERVEGFGVEYTANSMILMRAGDEAKPVSGTFRLPPGIATPAFPAPEVRRSHTMRAEVPVLMTIIGVIGLLPLVFAAMWAACMRRWTPACSIHPVDKPAGNGSRAR